MRINITVVFIIVVLLISFVSIIVIAGMNTNRHEITFKNNSNTTISYFLYQIDHGLKQHPEPIAFVVGTLNPKKFWTVKREFGRYYLEWKQGDKVLLKMDPFSIDKDMTFVYSGQ